MSNQSRSPSQIDVVRIWGVGHGRNNRTAESRTLLDGRRPFVTLGSVWHSFRIVPKLCSAETHLLRTGFNDSHIMFKEGGLNPEGIGASDESRTSLVHVPRAELVPAAINPEANESPDILSMFPETTPINFAIVSYFREKGPRALFAAYNNMSDNIRQKFKQAMAGGNLQSVIHHVEMNDSMNLKAEKLLHAQNESDQDFAQTFEKSTFLLIDRARRLDHKHRARAVEWQETGVAPSVEEGLPGSAEDAPAVRRKLAEMPLDMRDFLERVDPRVRRDVISDDEILNAPVEQLIKDFPRLSRRIAREFIMQGRPAK
jgi:hypothetical protein